MWQKRDTKVQSLRTKSSVVSQQSEATCRRQVVAGCCTALSVHTTVFACCWFSSPPVPFGSLSAFPVPLPVLDASKSGACWVQTRPLFVSQKNSRCMCCIGYGRHVSSTVMLPLNDTSIYAECTTTTVQNSQQPVAPPNQSKVHHVHVRFAT